MWRPLLSLALIVAGCSRRPPQAAEPERSALQAQAERAQEEGPDQVLEQCRLASFALAEGDQRVADQALRQAVGRMQDFRADGELRALIGAERSKEWKGEPYEKMMAFLYLGLLLEEQGDHGNALAMSKSAILADTGTSAFPYRADFVAAFVLQALAHERAGHAMDAERSMEHAIDALYVRAYTDHLSQLLWEVPAPEQPNEDAVSAARVLLLAGLPAALMARPRDPREAIDAALGQAADLRGVVLDGSRKDRPEDLGRLGKGAVRRSFDALEPLARGWQAALDASPYPREAELHADAQYLRDLLDDPGLVLIVEAGRGPRKVADGRYGEILRIVARGETEGPPPLLLDGAPLTPRYLDSVTYQAQTRGSRWVDGFLQGKAVFKDTAPVLGWLLLVSGDIANAARDPDDSGALATALYLLGAATWVAGALTNPAADTRDWEELPDTLWIVRADPTPGDHRLRVGGRDYTVRIPDEGSVLHLIPALQPGGPRTFGEPCRVCDVPLAIPGTPPPAGGGTP